MPPTPQQLESSDQPSPGGRAYSVAVATTVVAAVFALIVSALLLYDYGRRQVDDPLSDPTYLALKAALKEQPRNEKLQEQVRAVDAQLRHEWFRQRRFTAVGGWLLLGGVAIFLIAGNAALSMRRQPPMPGPHHPPRDEETLWTRSARWATGGLAVLLVGAAVALSLSMRSDLPKYAADSPGEQVSGDPVPDEPPARELPPPPTPDQIAANWPRFRGPHGSGVAAVSELPTAWDAASGEHILWKQLVPLPGNNSPVVWGDRLFLTGADETRREVYCFDAGTGELLWQQEAPGTPQSTAKPPKVLEATGYAAPTAVVDGRQVYAMFANGDVAAFTFNGTLGWARSLGIPENAYGHAASLAMWENLLLVQFDQASKKDGKSALLALDAATGETVWKVDREVPNSWTSPIVIDHAGRTQLITAADPWVIAYNPADGAELWRAKCLRMDVGPSPVFRDGVVYVANAFPAVSAIKADGQGDVTDSHILWQSEDGLPDTCSPLVTKDHVLVLASFGLLTCYDAASGEWLWEEDFETEFTSSPSLVGDRVYLIANDGKSWVVEPGKQGCTRIAEGDLGERCVTSPALLQGRIYLHGEKHLFCIGE